VKPPLRVAHVLPFSGVGGTEQATLRLAKAIALHGIESVAVCLDEATAVHDLFAEGGIETVHLHRREPGRAWRSVRGFTYHTARLALTFRRRGVRVVHCADAHAVTQQILLAARLAGAHVVCHIRNRNQTITPAHASLLAGVRQFIFVSEASWRDFGYPVESHRGQVVYDGIVVDEVAKGDAERREAREDIARELGFEPEAPLIGMVARVEPQKDFRTLAEATAVLLAEFPRLQVLVVGGTDSTAEQRAHFPEVMRTVEQFGVAGHIRFIGFRGDVPRLLSALDVSVLSTHWEGLPLVIWEAMAQGTPVIATAVDGIPEAIQHGETGLLVSHGNGTELGEAIASLLRHPHTARTLGRAGQAHARRSFSETSFAERVSSVYQAAVRRNAVRTQPTVDLSF
jgi:glycosyltransferase involved in cell wall biosynthesis